MNRRHFLRSTAAAAFAAGLPRWLRAEPSAAGPHPINIIYILADDLGYGDLACFGNPVVETPHIDSLARQGTVLTSNYASGPVCMPSRVSFLTGRYPYATGANQAVQDSSPSLNIPYLPAPFRRAGYATCAVGKWHAGNFPHGMKKIGFDEWAICAPGGLCDFYDYTMHCHDQDIPSRGIYSTDNITQHGLDFIDRHPEQPFFLYLAYTAPHFPLQAPEDTIIKYRRKADITEGAARVYAMIEHMDRGIGRIIEHLRSQNRFDNTLIIFASDNGPRFLGFWQGIDQTRYNAHLAGQKGLVLDGGIRVPGIIKWPRSLTSSLQTYPHLIHGIDWFPTLLAAAGINPPADADLPGVNLLPALQGKEQPPELTRCWSYNAVRPTDKSNGALRKGPWKLHRPQIVKVNQSTQPADVPIYPEDIPDYQLFRLDTDPFENHDLADAYPEKTRQMSRKFEQWFRQSIAEYRKNTQRSQGTNP